MPYYWKRGLVAAILCGLMLHVLTHNVERWQSKVAPNVHRTPFAPMVAVTLFALFCAMPGPPNRRR